MRTEDSKKRLLLGYCSEKTQDVLKILLPNFYVTSYNGIRLYSLEDGTHAPMNGIAIGSNNVKGVYGWKNVIDGKIGEMVDFFREDIENVKRKNSLLSKERFTIIRNINQDFKDNSSAREVIEVLSSMK